MSGQVFVHPETEGCGKIESKDGMWLMRPPVDRAVLPDYLGGAVLGGAQACSPRVGGLLRQRWKDLVLGDEVVGAGAGDLCIRDVSIRARHGAGPRPDLGRAGNPISIPSSEADQKPRTTDLDRYKEFWDLLIRNGERIQFACCKAAVFLAFVGSAGKTLIGSTSTMTRSLD